MSAGFIATADNVQDLADFLRRATEASRETGVWFCAYDGTEVTIPGGSTVRVGLKGEGDDMEYVIDDQVGS